VQLRDVADLIVEAAQPYVFLYCLDISDWVKTENGEWVVVPVTEALQGLIEPVRLEGGEVLLQAADLTIVFGELPHYNARIIDLPSGELDLADLYCTCMDHEIRTGPLLPKLPHSLVHVNSHDDCYLLVESRDDALGHRVIGRLLAILAGTGLAEAGSQPSDLTEPPIPLVIEALGTQGAITAAQEAVVVAIDQVRIPFARQSWRLGDEVTPPTHVIAFDRHTGEWQLEAR
jgi:hypothetical protein